MSIESETGIPEVDEVPAVFEQQENIDETVDQRAEETQPIVNPEVAPAPVQDIDTGGMSKEKGVWIDDAVLNAEKKAEADFQKEVESGRIIDRDAFIKRKWAEQTKKIYAELNKDQKKELGAAISRNFLTQDEINILLVCGYKAEEINTIKSTFWGAKVKFEKFFTEPKSEEDFKKWFDEIKQNKDLIFGQEWDKKREKYIVGTAKAEIQRMVKTEIPPLGTAINPEKPKPVEPDVERVITPPPPPPEERGEKQKTEKQEWLFPEAEERKEEKPESEFKRTRRHLMEFEKLWTEANKLSKQNKEFLFDEVRKEKLANLSREIIVLAEEMTRKQDKDGNWTKVDLIKEARHEAGLDDDSNFFKKNEFKDLLTKKAYEIYRGRSLLYNKAKKIIEKNKETHQLKEIIEGAKKEIKENGQYEKNGQIFKKDDKFNGRLIRRNGEYFFELAGGQYDVLNNNKISESEALSDEPPEFSQEVIEDSKIPSVSGKDITVKLPDLKQRLLTLEEEKTETSVSEEPVFVEAPLSSPVVETEPVADEPKEEINPLTNARLLTKEEQEKLKLDEFELAREEEYNNAPIYLEGPAVTEETFAAPVPKRKKPWWKIW